jgi:hypothetical protein
MPLNADTTCASIEIGVDALRIRGARVGRRRILRSGSVRRCPGTPGRQEGGAHQLQRSPPMPLAAKKPNQDIELSPVHADPPSRTPLIVASNAWDSESFQRNLLQNNSMLCGVLRRMHGVSGGELATRQLELASDRCWRR